MDLVRKSGPQEDTYNEIRALQEISFAHKEDSPAPDDYACNAAMSMFKYPAKEILRGPYAVDEWKPDVVQEYLDMMVPEKSLVFGGNRLSNASCLTRILQQLRTTQQPTVILDTTETNTKQTRPH